LPDPSTLGVQCRPLRDSEQISGPSSHLHKLVELEIEGSRSQQVHAQDTGHLGWSFAAAIFNIVEHVHST